MKPTNALTILNWLLQEGVDNSVAGTITVPEEGENEWEQNEMWWIDHFAAFPPCPLEPGVYFYYYCNGVNDDMKDEYGNYIEDYETIEIETSDNVCDSDFIHLYRIGF